MVLPAVIVEVGLKSETLFINGSQLIEKILPVYKIPIEFTSTIDRLLFVFLNYTLMPFFLIVPVMVSSIIAANAVSGEKERHTLETLLYTPVSNREFFLGKLLSAFLPAVVISLASFVIFFTFTNILFYLDRGFLLVRAWTWLPTILIINPAASLFGLSLTLLVSFRAKTFMEAQQISGLVIIPVILLIAAQISGVIIFSPLIMIIIGLVLAGIDFLLISIIGPRFEREQIINSL